MTQLAWIVTALGLLSSSLSANSALPAEPLAVPDGLGVNIHFTHPRPGEMKMLADAGFTWARMDFAWEGTEREKGIYDFAEYDDLLKSLDEFSIRPIFILDYSNRFYDDHLSPHTPEGIDAFAKWAAAAVTHFKGHAIVWEMYNEPNGSFWKPKADAEALLRLSLATGKAIHEADPAATFVGPATSTIDFPYLETCFKGGCLNDWAAVSVHPYRQTHPERAGDKYRRLREMIDRYAPPGKQIPILSGEWGYSTAWQSFDDDRQGKYLAREFLTNLANQIPISIWYDWHDDGTDAHDPEAHFGIVHNAYHAGQNPVYDSKPAYVAASTLAHALRGLHLIKRLAADSDDDYLLLFGDPSRLVVVAWTADKPAHLVTVSTAGDRFTRVSHIGETLPPLAAQGGELRLELTDGPQYITCPGADDAKLLNGLAWKRAPVDIAITAEGDMCHIALAGPWPEPFKGFVEVVNPEPAPIETVPRQKVQADAATRLLRFDVKLPAGSDGLRRINLRLLNEDGSVFYRTPRFAFVPVPFAVDPDHPANLPVVARADGDRKITSEQTLSLAPAASLTPATNPVVRLDYHLEPGWKFVRLSPTAKPVDLPGKPAEIGMWVKGTAAGVSLRARVVDTTGQCFQPVSTEAAHLNDDWTFVRFELLAASSGHWGGANDGVIHFPIHIDTLLLVDKTSREAGMKGQIDLTGPTLLYEQ